MRFQGDPPDVLQKVEVPLVSDEDCIEAYDTDIIEDVMLCAGSGKLFQSPATCMIYAIRNF